MSVTRLAKEIAAAQPGVSPRQRERHVAARMPCTGTGKARRYPSPRQREMVYTH